MTGFHELGHGMLSICPCRLVLARNTRLRPKPVLWGYAQDSAGFDTWDVLAQLPAECYRFPGNKWRWRPLRNLLHAADQTRFLCTGRSSLARWMGGMAPLLSSSTSSRRPPIDFSAERDIL